MRFEMLLCFAGQATHPASDDTRQSTHTLSLPSPMLFVVEIVYRCGHGQYHSVVIRPMSREYFSITCLRQGFTLAHWRVTAIRDATGAQTYPSHQFLHTSKLSSDAHAHALNFVFATVVMGSTSPRPHTVGTPSSSSSSNFDTNAYLNLDLTPRTKVQAMLAALDDDDSDKENLTKSTRQESPLKSSKATPRFQKKFQPQPTSGSSKHDSDDSDVPHARRGTFAARMQNLPDASKGTGKSGESEEEHTLSAGQPLVNNGSAVTEYGVGIAEDDNTASGPRFVSPGLPDDQSQDAGSLFVSPEKERTDGNQALEETSSPSRSPNISTSNNVRDRLQALVARRRRELSEKESELQPDTLFSEEEEVHGSQSPARSTKRARTPLIFDSSESEGDPEVSKKLTQQARPTRKASKKAIEQMHRETQRMSRNMQLTHEARTKVKFTTESLFAKFNFRQQQPAPHVHSELPDGSSSANTSSDAENRLPHDTPPSSPPSRGGSEKGGNGPEALSVERDILQSKTARQSNSDDESDGLLDLNKLLTQKRSEPSSKASQDTKPLLTQQKLSDVTVRRASVRRFAKSVAKAPILADSDDELEIVAPNKTSRLRIFDTIPTTKAKESGSLHALRALAHLNESDRKRNKNNGTMTPSELQSLLRRRAREQAMRERDEKIQRLREKGIVVQTEEEKEHEQMEIESMLEKARKEAYDLAKKEKEEARREGKEVPDMDDSDDDEDYGASDEEELDFSGSEDEDEDEDEDENKSRLNDDEDELGKDLDSKTQPSDLLDEEASESEGDDEDEDEEDPEEGADSSDGDASPATFVPRQNKRRRVLLSDDEDDEDDELALVEKSRATETNPGPSATPSPTKTAVSPTKDAFGFNNARPSALDLSQVFAGTMAEEQTQADLDTQLDTDSQQDSMAFLRGLPDPELPNYEDSLPVHSPVVTSLMVQDSQSNASPIRRNGHSQLSGPVNFETQTQRANAETQVFEMPEPTQDDGFHIGDSQPVLVDGSTATVDTVLIEQPLEVSDHTKKSRGRLQRGERFNATAEDAYDELSPVKDVDEGQVLDAFTKMRQERTKAAKAEAFNKKQSEAKAMFEEQAEESEDEYAGLGGASDDESQGELDEETKKMIDDQSNEAINERDIAAFYA